MGLVKSFNIKGTLKKQMIDNYLAAIKNEIPNLIQAEGNQKRFVEKIRELDLYRLNIGASKIYGTYKNIFICEGKKTIRTEESHITVGCLIRCCFYENTEEIFLLLLKTTKMHADEFVFEEIYWFDEDDNHLPIENEMHVEIFENLDIFFDE